MRVPYVKVPMPFQRILVTIHARAASPALQADPPND